MAPLCGTLFGINAPFVQGFLSLEFDVCDPLAIISHESLVRDLAGDVVEQLAHSPSHWTVLIPGCPG